MDGVLELRRAFCKSDTLPMCERTNRHYHADKEGRKRTLEAAGLSGWDDVGAEGAWGVLWEMPTAL